MKRKKMTIYLDKLECEYLDALRDRTEKTKQEAMRMALIMSNERLCSNVAVIPEQKEQSGFITIDNEASVVELSVNKYDTKQWQQVIDPWWECAD